MLQKLFVDGRGTLKLLKLLILNCTSCSTGKPFSLDKPAFCSKNQRTSVLLFIFYAKQLLTKNYRLIISETIYGDTHTHTDIYIYIYISENGSFYFMYYFEETFIFIITFVAF